MEKIIVGMSGGVDSSVSALKLKEQGYKVEGLFMKNWDHDDGTEYCSAKQDLEDALRVCDKLSIDLHTVNFAKEYWDNVFQHFLTEYKSGRTPNPDVLCNREIKFKVFADHAMKLGASFIATGHYVKKYTDDNQFFLAKGDDKNKDQSYFLHAISNDQLAKSLFPLGDIKKEDVRKIAKRSGLINHDKKDSTGICFIGERRFDDFLKTFIKEEPGDILDENDQVIGSHNGLMFHTIGQRQGLGVGGISNAKEEPWYVAEKNISNNTLLVVQGNENPLLYTKNIIASNCSWINDPPSFPYSCKSKIRYRQSDQSCVVSQLDKDRILIQFDDRQRAATPGQYIVFYEKDICLGGAVIMDTKNLS